MVYHLLAYLAKQVKVDVEIVSATSVLVSWVGIDIPETTEYTVYYQREDRNEPYGPIIVPSSNYSVVIEDLVNNMEYKFQVEAMFMVDGGAIRGQRSLPSARVVVLPSGKSAWASLMACRDREVALR
jgi:hypothetical protein